MEEKTLNKLRKGLLLPGEDKPTAPAVCRNSLKTQMADFLRTLGFQDY